MGSSSSKKNDYCDDNYKEAMYARGSSCVANYNNTMTLAKENYNRCKQDADLSKSRCNNLKITFKSGIRRIEGGSKNIELRRAANRVLKLHQDRLQ